jgi:hypothetical protein
LKTQINSILPAVLGVQEVLWIDKMLHIKDFKKLREENEYLHRKLAKAIVALTKMYLEKRRLEYELKKERLLCFKGSCNNTHTGRDIKRRV